MPNHPRRFFPIITCCGIFTLLALVAGCVRPPVVQGPESGKPYRSELADHQAKAFFAYSEYRLLLAESRWDEAISALERSLAFDPDSDFLQMNLAKVLLHKNETDRSMELLQGLLDRSPEHVEAHELLGDLLSYTGDHVAAIAHYRQAVALTPDDEMLQMRLAMALGRQGERDEAITVLQRLVEKHPDAKLARLALARMFEENDQRDLAAETYQQLRQDYPELQQAIQEYGRLLEDDEQIAEALQLYRDAIRRNPRLAAVRHQLAVLYLKQRRVREALEQFQAIRQQFPENLEILGKIGLIQLELENWVAAEETFRSLHRQLPDDDRNLYYLGMALLGQGKNQAAIEAMSPIREEAPIFSEAVLQLAYLYRQEGKIDKAIFAMRKLIARDVHKAEIYYYLAAFLGDEENYSEAKRVVEEGLTHFPEDVSLNYQLGVVLERSGNRPQALDAMQKVLELNPHHADALNFIAYHQAEVGDNLELALSRVQQALSGKRTGYIVDTLGWIYFKMGRFEESRVHLEEAINLLPDDPVILEHLADAYRALSQWDKAAATYRRVLDLDPKASGVVDKLNSLPQAAP